MNILPFLPINFYLNLSYFLHFPLLPLLLMSLQKILQFTNIYSHSYVYSGRYSWIFYSLQLADFLALLHAFLSNLRSFFILINYVLSQRTFPSVPEYPPGPPITMTSCTLYNRGRGCEEPLDSCHYFSPSSKIRCFWSRKQCESSGAGGKQFECIGAGSNMNPPVQEVIVTRRSSK